MLQCYEAVVYVLLIDPLDLFSRFANFCHIISCIFIIEFWLRCPINNDAALPCNRIRYDKLSWKRREREREGQEQSMLRCPWLHIINWLSKTEPQSLISNINKYISLKVLCWRKNKTSNSHQHPNMSNISIYGKTQNYDYERIHRMHSMHNSDFLLLFSAQFH